MLFHVVFAEKLPQLCQWVLDVLGTIVDTLFKIIFNFTFKFSCVEEPSTHCLSAIVLNSVRLWTKRERGDLLNCPTVPN